MEELVNQAAYGGIGLIMSMIGSPLGISIILIVIISGFIGLIIKKN